jgi:hypothetical protein
MSKLNNQSSDESMIIKVIDEQEFIKVDKLPVEAFYRIYEMDPVDGYRLLICHIVMETIWKVSTYKCFLEIEEMGIKEMRDKFKDINVDNAVGCTIFELKKGLKFVPDVGMFNSALNFKNDMESKYDIKMGGVVMVTRHDKPRFNRVFRELIKLYSRFSNFDFVETTEQAYESIKNFKF